MGLGTLFLGATCGLAALVAASTSVTVGVVTGVVLGIAIMAFRPGRYLAFTVTTGIFAMTAAGFGAYFGSNYVHLARGHTVRGLSVRDAPRFPRAARFLFVDGAPDVTRWGRHHSPGHRGAGVTHVVAPVVVSGWTPGEPVTLWACAEGSAPPRAWKEPGRRGVRLSSFATTGCAKARQRAEQVHRLRSAPGALLIHWEDPAGALARARGLALGVPGILLGLYLVSMIIVRVAARRGR